MHICSVVCQVNICIMFGLCVHKHPSLDIVFHPYTISCESKQYVVLPSSVQTHNNDSM